MAVYLAAVLEYLVAEILELAGNNAKDNKQKRIKPKDLLLGIKKDEELNEMTNKWSIQGGVVPGVLKSILGIKHFGYDPKPFDRVPIPKSLKGKPE
jgi:histone H2A